MKLPPAVVIHGLGHARAALAPGRPVLLLSGAGAGAYAGAGWWRQVIAAAGATQPDALDCGDEPGRALEAWAAGCGIVVLAPGPAWDSVRARSPGLLLSERPRALDLAVPGAARHLVSWLQGDSEGSFG